MSAKSRAAWKRFLRRMDGGKADALLQANRPMDAARLVSLSLPGRAWKQLQATRDLLRFADRMIGHRKRRELLERARAKVGKLPPEFRKVAKAALGLSDK